MAEQSHRRERERLWTLHFLRVRVMLLDKREAKHRVQANSWLMDSAQLILILELWPTDKVPLQ